MTDRRALFYAECKLRLLQGRHRCEKCGHDDVAVLHLHHPPGVPKSKDWKSGTKRKTISPQLMLEARKCMVLCQNCHAREHIVHKDVWDLAMKSTLEP